MNRKNRTVFLNGTIADKDPRLTFYADMTALTLLQRIERREEKFYKTIEHHVIASKTLTSISYRHISKLIDYLLERDVYGLSMDYYRSLREEDPRVCIRRFEEILVLDQMGLADAVEGLKIVYADVDRRLMDLFDGISLEELLVEAENH